MAQTLKNLLVMQETQVPSLGQEEPLEKGMAKEVVGKVDPQKRVLCLAQVFLRCGTAFANGVSVFYLLSDLF